MDISKELSKGSTALMVLSVISKADMYGYQIIRTVANFSDDVFQMNEGTLYPILHSLEKVGFLESYWMEKTENTRKRKYYHITEKGKKELARQEKQWESFSTAVQKVLGGAVIVPA